jgi:HPt (histidine-containing phosphotransfer) domain-containing protein
LARTFRFLEFQSRSCCEWRASAGEEPTQGDTTERIAAHRGMAGHGGTQLATSIRRRSRRGREHAFLWLVRTLQSGLAMALGERNRLEEHELLDARTLLAACGSDAAILSRICQAVRDQLPKDLTALEHAFRNRDAPLLSEEAHRLHGMVAAFSSVAGTLASDLEDRAGQGELKEAERLLNQLRVLAPELLRQVSRVTLDSLEVAGVNQTCHERPATHDGAVDQEPGSTG